MPSAAIIEDSAAARAALGEWLAHQGFDPVHTADGIASARALLSRETFDLVLLDLELPDGNGLDLLEQIEEGFPTEVVVITGHGSVESAVAAIRGGVIDYLAKPVDMHRLGRIIENFLRARELRGEVSSLRDELRRLGRFGIMVGASPGMQEVYDLIARVAPTKSTAFVTGETGTGKELVARTIHQLSPRAKMPFVAINCGAVAPNLIESELFGHERGSFTGADRQHRGIFERTHGGTLFLDEITEMPIELQVKLLRVIETGTVNRIGGDRPIDIDVRLITATNRDAEAAAGTGKLRQDLLYRLHVFPIRVPPLRDRGDDVDLLTRHFLDGLNREGGTRKEISKAAMERIRAHAWPGNVRELRNVIERAYIIAQNEIRPEHLPVEGTRVQARQLGSPVQVEMGISLAEAERRLILATLEHVQGDKKKAASVLGISLKTLYNRLNSYGGVGVLEVRRSGPRRDDLSTGFPEA